MYHTASSCYSFGLTKYTISRILLSSVCKPLIKNKLNILPAPLDKLSWGDDTPPSNGNSEGNERMDAEYMKSKTYTLADSVTTLECGHAPSIHAGFTNGWGTDEFGNRSCYECCATRERYAMIASGKGMLYLTETDGRYELSYWPGALRFPVIGRPWKGRHNIARVRYDVDFRGPDGFIWHGTQYGNNTQIAYVKRTKRTRI